jgi:gentisate 1,2-dioxygenase
MTQLQWKSIKPSAVLSAYFRAEPDPLWESLHHLVPKTPNAPAPGVLELSGDSPAAAESGELIGAKEAIRRVLVLENPALRGQSSITPRCTPDCS